MNTLWIGLGGALGSIARFHLGELALRRAGPHAALPWGTLAVNLIGSLLIGVLMQLALQGRLPDAVRLPLVAGVLGGFTTYSAFNYEWLRYAQAGAPGRAAIYVAVTLVGCALAGLAGWSAARLVTG